MNKKTRKLRAAKKRERRAIVLGRRVSSVPDDPIHRLCMVVGAVLMQYIKQPTTPVCASCKKEMDLCMCDECKDKIFNGGKK